MTYETLLVADAGATRTVTLNRPERRNAMTSAMQNELIGVLELTAADRQVRVLVLRGAGEAFCAGLDLEQLRGLTKQTDEEHRADAERVGRLFRTLYELPVATIAAVQGSAIAGGTGLATICDYTLAVSEAKFGFTEVRIGFVPGLVSAYLALQVGDKRARGLLLSGRLFRAAEARDLGLVNEVVDRGVLDQRVEELADALTANSPASIAMTKRLLAEQNRAWLDTATELAMQANAESRNSADFREGVAAFLEKRRPVWCERD